MLIYDLVSINICDEFADEKFFQTLIYLMKDSQVEALIEWPLNFGGAEVYYQIIVGVLDYYVRKFDENFPDLPSGGRKRA